MPEAELRARLATAVDRPVVVDGRAWSVGFSAGVTTSPADEPISAAVQRADAAMYRAKARRGA